MPKSEKKEVHHIAKVVDKLAAKQQPPKHVKQVHKQNPRRLVDISQQQGEYAAASVFFPEQLSGARVPDRVAIPTSTSQTLTTVTVPAIAFPDGYVAFFRFIPNTAGCIRYALTMAGALVATEQAVVMNGDVSLSTLVDQLRIVSAAMRLTSVDSALNIQGVWYAANHKSETNSGTLVGLDPMATAPKYRNRATGKLTDSDPSMRFVWFPGDEEDQDFEPYPGQMAADNTVTDVVVLFTNSGHSLKADVTMNLEFAPTGSATQILPTAAVIGDPSTYNQSMQQGMVNTNMNVVTSVKFNDDVKKVSGAIKGITNVVGDVVSGNWAGAVKDGISSAGAIFEGAKSGFNLISNAISSWFGTSEETDHALRCLLMLSHIGKDRRSEVLREVKGLVEQKLVPNELLEIMEQLERLNLRVKYENDKNGRPHAKSVECDADTVLVPKPPRR